MPAARRLFLLAAAIASMFALFALGAPHSPQRLHDMVSSLGVAAPLVFVLVWAVLTPALASGTLLALAAGLSFGPVGGTLVGIAGATLGGVLAFAIARRFGRTAAEQLGGPRLHQVKRRIERRGFLAVLSARMAPGVPATLLNYACGLSRVRLRDFVAGNALGGAPRMLAYASLGASGGHLASGPALLGVALIAVLALAVPAAMLWRRLRPVAA